MSQWFSKLIKKHTCHFCDKKLDKKDIYTINMDTLEGPHTISSCEKCAMEFDQVLKAIQEVHNDD
jgi:RNase P subunit RPR2